MAAISKEFYAKPNAPGDERIFAVIASNAYTVLAFSKTYTTAMGFDDPEKAGEYLQRNSPLYDDIRLVFCVSSDFAPFSEGTLATRRVNRAAAS